MQRSPERAERASPERAERALAPARRSAVQPFFAMEMMREANALEAAGWSILHLEVGQPGTAAPRRVREAARGALEDGRIGYTDALGLGSLRARIAAHYASAYGVRVAPERVAVTTGSSGGFILAFLAGFDAGARIALATPAYPAYRNILQALDCEVAVLEASAATRWTLTPDMIRAAHAERPLQGVLLASPANPSGVMTSPEALGALVETCRELGLRFVSDEIYHGLTYESPAETALRFGDDVLVVNSFSKYYCMTGWRIGWLVLPAALVRSVERLAQNLYISPPALSQIAASAAFDSIDECEAKKAVYAENRRVLLDALGGLGFDEILPADGAFYLYAGVRRFTKDSMAFARRLLHETGVAVTPGLDFDPARGAGYVRLSYAGSTEDMHRAAERLAGFLDRLSETGTV